MSTPQIIDKPGYYDIPMSAYLADPCPAPALSTSVIEKLAFESPIHARLASPKLSKRPDNATSRGDQGSAVHALASGTQEVIWLPFDDWRTKAAQEARQDVRENGGLACLEADRMGIESAAVSIKIALAQLGPGKFEQTMVWQTNGVWSRGRADWLSDDGVYDVDFKTVDSANASVWVRRVAVPSTLHIQMGNRSLGHEAITGRPRKMLWLLAELAAPWAWRYVECGGKLLQLGRQECTDASHEWAKCLAGEQWSGYPREPFRAEAPPFMEFDYAERRGASL